MLGCLVLNYISGYEGMLVFIMLCVLVDAFWGIFVALKMGRFARSDLFRQSVIKMSAYGTVLFMLIGMERILGIESVLPTAIIASVIAACELWSICGNIMIVNPNIPVLSLMRNVLKGEIARKLGIEESDVETALNRNETLSEIKAEESENQKI